MADYQRVVEFLRDFRAAPVQQVTDELRHHAAAYVELCTRANERLRECSALLQRGLRSEAVHLAEQAPNLLDLVAALDLPDAQAWAEFCQQYEMPVPPPLQIDRAVQLQDAYEHDEAVGKLFAQHRLLALRRAPVAQRLQVMRQLAAADRGPFWEDDIRQFERVRQNQLYDDLITAHGNRDRPALARIVQEVEQTDWIEPLNEKLQRGAAETARRLQLTQVNAEMKQLRAQLRQAYAAREHRQCAHILQQMKQTLQSADLSNVSADLEAEIKPIVAYVRHEEQTETSRQATARARQELTQLLDADAPTAEIETAYDKLRRLDEPIPQPLEQRYHDRLAKRERAGQRTYRVRLATVAALLLVAIGVTAVLVFQHLQTHSASAWAARISAANDQRNLPLAQQLIAEQERAAPNLSAVAGLADAKTQTRRLQQQFDHDQTILRFLLDELGRQEAAADRLLAGLGQSLPTSEPQAPPPADPSTGELLAAAAATRGTLENARARTDLAWVDSAGQLQDAIRRLDLRYQQITRTAAASVASELLELTRQIDATSSADLLDGLARIDQVTSAARAYRDHPDLDAATHEAVQATLARARQRRETLEQAQAHFAEMNGIRARAGSANALRTALESFVERHPQSPVARDFTAAIEVANAARSVEDWQRMAGPWRDSLEVPNLPEARNRIAALNAYLENHPTGPLSAAARDYLAYLQQAVNTLAVPGTWIEQFQDLLTNPLMADLAYLETTDGDRYYVLGDIRLRSGHLNERTTITFQAIDPQDLTRRQEIRIEPPRQLSSDQPTRAPHARFAAESLQQMRSINEYNWETFGFQFIQRIIQHPDLDTVVAAILVEHAVRTNLQVVGWAVDDLYERTLTDLARQDLQSIIWYNPDQPVPPFTRDALRAIMEQVPEPERARERLAGRKAELFESISTRYTGTGVLLRDQAGDWTVQLPGRTGRGETAHALRLAGRRATLVPVATRRGDQFEVNERALRGIPEGTIVFITE